MAIKAPFGGNKEFKVAPAGNHIARVCSIIHLGVLPGEYMGQPKETDTVRIGFELSNERETFKEGEEPKPFIVSAEYTVSMNEKAKLRKIVEGIEGVTFYDEEAESYDVTELLGKVCMLNVSHKTSAKGNTYAKIESAAPLPKGIAAPEAFNQAFILDYDNNWSEAKFNALPDFIKEKMRTSRNYRNKMNPQASGESQEQPTADDLGIPF